MPGSWLTAAIEEPRCASWNGWSGRCAANSASAPALRWPRCGPSCSHPTLTETQRRPASRALRPRRRAAPDRPVDHRRRARARDGRSSCPVRAGIGKTAGAAVARPARGGAWAACRRRRCCRPGGCLAVRAGARSPRGSVPALPGAARRPGRRVPKRDRGRAAGRLT